MIRLPQPTTQERIVEFAQKTTTATKESEDLSEAKGWFNG